MKYRAVICACVALTVLGQPAAAATPIGAQRLDESATASQPAVRIDPPDPQPVVILTTEEIIRDVWSGEPQFIINKAVRTAKRESGPNLKINAQNYCCAGIFQIYFSVHRAMLRDFGVFKNTDLYDPRVNATVALALFHEVGWQPWNGGA